MRLGVMLGPRGHRRDLLGIGILVARDFDGTDRDRGQREEAGHPVAVFGLNAARRAGLRVKQRNGAVEQSFLVASEHLDDFL